MSQSMARLEKTMDKDAYLTFLMDRGKSINPLFQLPNVSNGTIMPDWMHVCDEGSFAVAAGQILKELLPSFPGTSQDERCANLWQEIQKMYEERDFPGCKRLKKLTVKDIVKPKKAQFWIARPMKSGIFAPFSNHCAKDNACVKAPGMRKLSTKWPSTAAICTTV